MKLLLSFFVVILLVGACAATEQNDGPAHDDASASQHFLNHQLPLLSLHHRIYDPDQQKKHQREIANRYNPLDNLDNYKHPKAVKELLRVLNCPHHVRPDEVFSIFDSRHLREASLLFETLFFAKNWDTFYKTACWARQKFNAELFVYVLNTAIVHNKESRNMIPLDEYEIFPTYYFSHKTLREAYAAKLRGESAIICANRTTPYNDVEDRVAYFRDDVGLSNYLSHWHKWYTFWDDPSWKLRKDRQGELFFYLIHTLVARYDMERLSNDLQPTRELAWEDCLKGSAPFACHVTWGEIPARPDGLTLSGADLGDGRVTVADLVTFEGRIRDAIYRRAVLKEDGTYEPLGERTGIDVLGSLVEGGKHSKNQIYYGSLHNAALGIIARITDPLKKYSQDPGTVNNYASSPRDPIFYEFYKRLDGLFKEYKDLLPPYKRDQLAVIGVSITGVDVDELNTTFEDYDIPLNDALTLDLDGQEVVGRVQRLTHKPFSFKIDVHSDTERELLVRAFIAPKEDWNGAVIPLNEKRWRFVEWDKYVIKVSPGKNTIERSSAEFSAAVRECVPWNEKEVDGALKCAPTAGDDKALQRCGLPTRLLLPKGKPEGMTYTLFIAVTNWEKEKSSNGTSSYQRGRGSVFYCGDLNDKYPDLSPLGYPLDRPIPDEEEFLTDNMIFTDFTITFNDSLE